MQNHGVGAIQKFLGGPFEILGRRIKHRQIKSGCTNFRMLFDSRMTFSVPQRVCAGSLAWLRPTCPARCEPTRPAPPRPRESATCRTFRTDPSLPSSPTHVIVRRTVASFAVHRTHAVSDTESSSARSNDIPATRRSVQRRRWSCRRCANVRRSTTKRRGCLLRISLSAIAQHRKLFQILAQSGSPEFPRTRCPSRESLSCWECRSWPPALRLLRCAHVPQCRLVPQSRHHSLY